MLQNMFFAEKGKGHGWVRGCQRRLKTNFRPCSWYSLNFVSELMSVILSEMACAIISRSLGSLWLSCNGSPAYAIKCLSVIGIIFIPASAMWENMSFAVLNFLYDNFPI